MKILDLEPGSKVTVEITVRTEKLEFETYIMDQVKGAAIIAPIRVNGKVLSLRANGVKISLIYTDGEKPPVMWEYVPLPSTVHKGEACYECSCSMPGTVVNRRNTFRLYVGKDGVAQVGPNRKGTKVLVKDVSEGGFAFVFHEKIEVSQGEPVRLVFDDCQMGLRFNLQGRLVRVVQLDESRFVYGCKLIIKNPALSKYIAEKQREMLARELKKRQERKVETIDRLEEAFRHKEKTRIVR